MLPYRGRPLIEWVIECLAPQVDELLISANRNIETYGGYGYAVIGDRIAGFPGPLGGVQAALSRASGDWILTVPCDTPHLPADLAQRLCQEIHVRPEAIAVASTSEAWQPTIALMPRSAATTLQTYLESGRRKVREWIAEQPHRVVRFPLSENFANLNCWEP